MGQWLKIKFFHLVMDLGEEAATIGRQVVMGSEIPGSGSRNGEEATNTKIPSLTK